MVSTAYSTAFSLWLPNFRLQMVKLRSKLHLSRQGRKLSLTHATSPDECNAASPTQPAGTTPESGPAEFPPPLLPGPTFSTLPEDLLIRVASFCEVGDLLRLQRCSKALHSIFENPSVIEQILFRLVSPEAVPAMPPHDPPCFPTRWKRGLSRQL